MRGRRENMSTSHTYNRCLNDLRKIIAFSSTQMDRDTFKSVIDHVEGNSQLFEKIYVKMHDYGDVYWRRTYDDEVYILATDFLVSLIDDLTRKYNPYEWFREAYAFADGLTRESFENRDNDDEFLDQLRLLATRRDGFLFCDMCCDLLYIDVTLRAFLNAENFDARAVRFLADRFDLLKRRLQDLQLIY